MEDTHVKRTARAQLHNQVGIQVFPWFFNAKPSQFLYERLRRMMKEGKAIAEVYEEAKELANLKKIQNIKQKVIQQENPVGHSFEALATINVATNKIDQFLLLRVQNVPL